MQTIFFNIITRGFASKRSMKAGVSLIAVLLFMLVATIAATATWKWITSEGRSSASRMLQREAYQSAVAGIETARTWMAYHANETGALIKQYKDGGNIPIRLNNHLAELSGGKQDYDVYLVGVNTAGSTYKLKLYSKGSARSGSANHSEVAILNVNGLYQVRIPDMPNAVAVNYTYAYFGGSTSYSGSHKHTSMVINGDWSGNPAGTEGDFIVTGNATLSGSDITVGATACIGGNLSAQNGFEAQNVFVGGDVTNFNPIIGQDAYFAGNVSLGSACGNYNFQVGGNLTVGGTLNLTECQTRTVGGNTCVLTTGQIKTNGNAVNLQGSVWMAADYSIWKDGDDNYDQSEDFVVGSAAGSSVYIKNAHPWSDYSDHRDAKSFTEEKKGAGNERNMICEKSGSTPECAEYGTCYAFMAPPYRCCKKYVSDATCETWKHWHNGPEDPPYSPYPVKASKTNLYYLFKEEAFEDVEFKSYYNAYWGADTWAYHVGGVEFYNLWDIWHEYNYDRDATEPITGSPYCYSYEGVSGRGHKEEKWHRPTCGVKPWFTVEGSFQAWTNDRPISCAEDTKDHCDNIWHSVSSGTGCDGSNYKVDDMLKTGVKAYSKYANKNSCVNAILARDHNDKINFNMADLYNCYSQAVEHDENSSEKELYNGYLVVEFTDENQGIDLFNSPSGALRGKYIFMFTSSTHTAISGANFPPTADAQSMVFLYLENGSTGTLIFKNGGSGTSNYFIYTKGDISEIHGYQPINGSVYAEVGNGTCAKIQNMNNNTTLIFDQSVVTDMAQNGIICDYSALMCGGEVNKDDDDDEVVHAAAFGEMDSYYISVAPQLSVSIESQYKNKETIANLNNPGTLSGSFIVLPRVIYLPTDAKGQLSDYYSVVPLNASGSVSGINVGCDAGIPTSGNLTSSGNNLDENYYTCYVSGTVDSKAMTVPFWVIVSGGYGDAPKVSFEHNFVQVPVNATESVSLSATADGNAIASCRAYVKVLTSSDEEWSVTPVDGVSYDNDNGWYVVNVAVGSELTPAFSVKNESSASGSVSLMIVGTDESCVPGEYQNEILYNNTSVNVEREGLAAYCAGPGASNTKCASGGEYDQLINQPNCIVTDAVWVNAQGSACYTTNKNVGWTCGLASDITLQKTANPTGCEVIVPSVNNKLSRTSLEAGQTYTLYADVKAKQQVFHTGFAVEGSLDGGTAIKINVAGPGTYAVSKTCTYSNYLSESARAEKCDVPVYRGSTVTLSFGNNDEDVPDAFSYWKCESGIDCPDDRPDRSTSYQMTIVGENTVKAHFGEQDKHCFFDEFRTRTSETARGFRNSLTCSNTENEYCIADCDDKCSLVVPGTSAKWRFMSKSTADFSDIVLEEGKVYLDPAATRGKKETDKKQAIIMSSIVPGLTGTLKAQFQVPVEKLAEGDVNKSSVRKSGFILKASEDLSNYLMLNVYSAAGDAKARICLNGTSSCKSKSFGTTLASTDVVLVSAELSKETLRLSLYPNAWTEVPYVVIFSLDNSTLPGLGALANYEYIGYSLSDPNFKLYGIGWQSTEYDSECWDTYPTISCSFKANYAGGIVPQSTTEKSVGVKPWFGLSPWFDEAATLSCTPEAYSPEFRYNGTDNEGCSVSSEYVQCGTGLNYEFHFTESGAHGYRDPDDDVLVKNVMVTASHSNSNCSFYGEATAAAWAYNGVAANCGEFWVGELRNCSRSAQFDIENGVEGLEGTYYTYNGISTTVEKRNLRDANLLVTLVNENSLTSKPEIEIYLFSQNSTDGYTYGKDVNVYSLPYKVYGTGETQELSISVNALSNAPGFDPENVVGVYVKDVSGGSVTISRLESDCPHEVKLTQCVVKNYRMGRWTIDATLKNHSKLGEDVSLSVAAKTGSSVPSGTAPSCAGAGTGSICSWSGDVTSFTWEDANAYNNGTYTFVVSTTIDDEAQSVECSADAPTVVPTCQSSVSNIGAGVGLPEFSFSISGCPTSGCRFKVSLSNGSVVATNTYNSTSSVTAGNPYNVNQSWNPLPDGTYKYILENDDSDSNTPAFGCESGEFTVGGSSSSSAENSSSSTETSSSSQAGESSSSVISSSSSEPESSSSSVSVLSVTCSRSSASTMDNQTGKTAGGPITVTPYEVSGCNSDCSYSVSVQNRTLSPAQESSTYNGTAVSFVDAGASGTENYTLTISRGLESHSCTFSVTYVANSSSSIESSSSGGVSSSSGGSSESSCVTSNEIIPSTNNNTGINASTTFSGGCFQFYTGKACQKVQVENANGSGSITINGTTFACGYTASTSITAQSTVTLVVPASCNVGRLYLSDCY